MRTGVIARHDNVVDVDFGLVVPPPATSPGEPWWPWDGGAEVEPPREERPAVTRPESPHHTEGSVASTTGVARDGTRPSGVRSMGERRPTPAAGKPVPKPRRTGGGLGASDAPAVPPTTRLPARWSPRPVAVLRCRFVRSQLAADLRAWARLVVFLIAVVVLLRAGDQLHHAYIHLFGGN